MLPNELLDLLNNNDWENAIIFLNQITGDLNDEELAALARCYSRSSIYDSAIEKYTELISRQPETAKWYYCRGRQHYMKRLWEDAIADFSKALAINKDYFIVKYSIAYAYIQLSGSAARRSEDSFSKAIQHIEDCHELYGEYSDEKK